MSNNIMSILPISNYEVKLTLSKLNRDVILKLFIVFYANCKV